MSKKEIIIIVVALIMIKTLEQVLIIGGILLLLIVFLKRKENKKEEIEEEDELEVIEANDSNPIRIQNERLEEIHNDKITYMRDVDVRQFKGRKDVTIDEVIDYMIERSQYIGIEKREYQMQRICQVCNLTENDMNEVFKRTWGNVKVNEDKEGQKIADYMNEKIKENYLTFKDFDGNDVKVNSYNDLQGFWRGWKEYELSKCKTKEEREKIEKIFPESYINQKENERREKDEKIIRSVFYDDWLKMKGYTHE